MTYQEAMKVIELNAGRLSGSMQEAVATIVLHAGTRTDTCTRLAGIFKEQLEDITAPGHTTGISYVVMVDTLRDVIETIEDYGRGEK